MSDPVILHDHAASLATFVEITFGVNIAWVAFARFRDFLRKSIDKKSEAYIAATLATEVKKEEHQDRLSNLKSDVTEVKERHKSYQDGLYKIARAFSVFMAIACLVVLYWDLLEFLGYYVAVLITPLPIYACCSGVMALCLGLRRFDGHR
jgi:hypothetical protein